MSTSNALKQSFEAGLANLSDKECQTKLAARLRDAAIKHLTNSTQPVARGFRIEAQLALGKAYQEFLAQQARDKVWGTYIEATALAEALGVNLVVTPIAAGKAQSPICLYHADNPKAQTIHLFNNNNTHWWYSDKPYSQAIDTTNGDGNCLYNAIAQGLRANVAPKFVAAAAKVSESSAAAKLVAVAAALKAPSQTVKTNTSLSASTPTKTQTQFFANPHQQKVVEHQKAIAAAIARQPTAQELAKHVEQEELRISQLPEQERRQIAADYRFALTLAMEESDSFNKPRLSIVSTPSQVISRGFNQ